MKKPSIQERKYLYINIHHYSLDGYDYTTFFETLHLESIKGIYFDGTEILITGKTKNGDKMNFYFISVKNIDKKFMPLQNEIELLKEFFIIHYGL